MSRSPRQTVTTTIATLPIVTMPETCECEYEPITPPDCDDNDCNTADSYNAETL